MINGIKLTSREYTITLSDNNLQYVLDNDLIESIKNAVYKIEDIDIIIYHHQRRAFIVDVIDENLDPKLIYTKIIETIATHRLSGKP